MSSKSKAKRFDYELQAHQENCVKNIVSIFENLQQNKSFTEVLAEHHKKNKYNYPIHDNRNIDIMMETGTGKTFTFIKTIFELNKNFGYNKFIILIPSVAIREGTQINLEDTREYFKGIYSNQQEKEIVTFVYESGKVSEIRQFIGSSGLSVLVMTPSSFNSRDNILNRPLENETKHSDLLAYEADPPKSYLDCLKRESPIIIMDEPHRFEGDAFKLYFAGFDNYYLRFGATFPKNKDSVPLSNVAYVLDSISSFRQNLVKKIVVYTQDIITKTDNLIAIDNKKAIVNTYSNGINTKRDLKIGDIFNGKAISKINKDSIILTDGSIEKVDYSLSDESLRIMIKETIKIHFAKEQILFEQGIKALTLFFIESNTNLFRGDNPKVKNIFEEEYQIQLLAINSQLSANDPYKKYLENDFDVNGNLQVHKGYFSGDKGNSDEKVKTGVNEILKDKKKLLSFDSPTRFIFSIWALQEGWDNPNVFIICKLSNQGSEISKMQQIGRGLRICVNQNLQRYTLQTLKNNQEEFWKINNLDIVVSSKEQGFVEAIQNEILSNSLLIAETFTEQDLKKLLKEKGNFDDSLVRIMYRKLQDSDMIIFQETINGIDIFKKSPDFSKILKEQNLPEEQVKILQNLFATDINTLIQNANNKKNKKNIYIKQTHLEEFKILWNTINKNAFYILENLNEEQEKQLIKNIKNDIEALNIEKILLQTIRAELHINKIGEHGAISESVFDTFSYKNKIDYLELVRSLSNKTKTPIAFIVKIFNVLSDNFKNKMLINNPKQAQSEISAIIEKHLVEMIKLNVTYKNFDVRAKGIVLSNIFETKNEKTYLKAGSVGKFQEDIIGDFNLKSKWIFEEVIEYDSDFELKIIKEDHDIDSIEIFGKLPRLKIQTPLGEYNPEFCYAIKNSDGNKVFFIVEAKGYDNQTDVPANEQAKINFAQKYFVALSEFYKDKNIKIYFKKRINKQQLSELITF